MKIQKRDGRLEQLSIDKIIYRLKKLKNDTTLGKLTTIDTDPIALRIVASIYDGVSSSELDEETARIAISMTENLEYAKLASRIIISNLHKNTTECFSENMEKLYNNIDKNGMPAPVLADNIIEFIRENKDIINEEIDYSRDYSFDYFGFKTLEKSYLMKLNGKLIERPQHLYMRVAIQVNLGDIQNVLKTYHLISQHLLTFASPSMFNSGGRLGNLSSCFHEDTIVATINKGPIKIKDVEIGDSVITHLGNVKKVQQLHKNLLNDRKLYNVEIAKTAPIKVTDNHKIWTISPKKIKDKERKERVCYDLEFVQNFLNEKGAKLLSTEYINIKTKLQIECICKNIANVSFESIYYGNILCNDRKCIYERNKLKSKNLTEPHWKSIEDLQNGDYIGIPNKLQESNYIKSLDTLLFTKLIDKNHFNIDFNDKFININSYWIQNNKTNTKQYDFTKEHSSINRYWDINNDFAKFVGIFYGDGHIHIQNSIIRGICITIHDVNSNLIDFCKNVGKNIFGIEPSIYQLKNQNVIQIHYRSNYIGEVFKECFGKGFNGKFIWNEMYSWNKDMILSLLEGLVTTDGCVTKRDCMSLQMSNVKFMRQLYYLLRNNNIDTSYGKEKRAKNGTENHIEINIPISEINKQNINKYYTDNRMDIDIIKRCKNQFSPIEVDGFKFLKFQKKTQITENLPEYVYTLGIEDDHSYNVGGIVSLNCFLIGTEDSVEGIFKTMSDVAQISKVGGGIGLHIDNIRSKGSAIRGTNGHSDGIIPMLKVYNEISSYINQCFTPDTYVYSKSGPKQMKDINTNDYLVTIDGSFKKVNQVIINQVDKEILEIRSTNTLFPVKVTKEHELYLIKDQKKITKFSVIKNRLDKQIIKPEFYNAGELTENDLVGFPIPTFVEDNDNNDLEFYKLYGMTLKDNSYVTLDMLHDINNLKRIYEPFLHLPKIKILKIIEGLIGSDLKEFYFSNTSKELVMQIKYMFLRLGIILTFESIEQDNITQQTVYSLKHYDSDYFEWNGILWGRIKSINKITYKGDVYDFNMIDNHNYLTDMGLVHNSGKRKGSFAIYLSPSHPDIMEFLDLRKNQGSENLRARDLFYAMWIPDLFMKQIEKNAEWYLMDPDECPGLQDVYGDEYETLYWKYVEEKRYRKVIQAQDIWVKIVESQIETGTPYILYKDQINMKSNQKNVGVIKSSNLCCEITLYSDANEYAVCNLASLALPKYVKLDAQNKLYFDHQQFFDVVKYLVLPMNNIIDFNYYPVPETRKSNLKNRPIGLGIQGFSSLLTILHIPFESEEASKLNKEIWETMYFASLTGSMELSKKDGPYSTFKGSPLSEGKFQFDLWKEFNGVEPYFSGRWDWENLRSEIIIHGVRNSTLLCQMPTASSAQIMGNSESVECFDSCIYKRRVLSGEYVICNKYLVADLTKLGLWNKELKDTIIAHDGSVQDIPEIPDNIKEIYKTVWEISMKSVINQAADRGIYIDQTQSMNLFMASPTIKKLTSMHFTAWKKHLKTGIYYLRSKSKANSAKFSIDSKLVKKGKKSAKKQEITPTQEEILMCSIENREACDLCTS